MRERNDELKAALKAVIEEVGSMHALGRLIDISQQAISQWDRVPAKHIIEIERATGVPRNALRPDLYRGYGSVDEAIAFIKAAGYRVTKLRAARKKSNGQTQSPALNAIGKPFGANYDPNYRMHYKPSYGHLRAPYGPSMRFVGDPPETDERHKRGRRSPSTPLLDGQPGGSARNIRNWKDLPDSSTARAARSIGGEYRIRRWKSGTTGEISYTISYRSSVQDWDEVDYPRGKPGTLNEAKRLAEEDHAQRWQSATSDPKGAAL
jgi:DNA-binding transcriptional regulator YdaS (Cro superfamily)